MTIVIPTAPSEYSLRKQAVKNALAAPAVATTFEHPTIFRAQMGQSSHRPSDIIFVCAQDEKKALAAVTRHKRMEPLFIEEVNGEFSLRQLQTGQFGAFLSVRRINDNTIVVRDVAQTKEAAESIGHFFETIASRNATARLNLFAPDVMEGLPVRHDGSRVYNFPSLRR